MAHSPVPNIGPLPTGHRVEEVNREADRGDPAGEASRDLVSRAVAIVRTADLGAKIVMAKATARDWHHGRLSVRGAASATFQPPANPGRPDHPRLLAPRDMPKRSAKGAAGRIAMLHALAHIELAAVDLMWDLIARAPRSAPRAMLHDFVRVAVEEAKHFDLLQRRLTVLGSHYGALPAHDGLWQAAQSAGDNYLARVAIIPLVLEARGLDVSPGMIRQLEGAGDQDSARILTIIYDDEKRHVAFGLKWFRHFCARGQLPLEPTFHRLIRTHFRGAIRPPFNDAARAQAGLAPGFYKPLAAFG